MNDFEQSIKALRDGRIDFIVIGGAALAIHGSAHLTYDLDICYSRSPENMRRIAETLAPYHPRLRDVSEGVPFRFDAEAIAHGLNFTLATDLGDLDLFGEVAGIGLYDKVLPLSVERELFGWSCRVLSLQGLIQAKRATGRTKDLLVLPELEALHELETQLHTSLLSTRNTEPTESPQVRNNDDEPSHQI